MQVKPLLPSRKVRIAPCASMATNLASLATPGGAADNALLIICSSPCGVVDWLAGEAATAAIGSDNKATDISRTLRVVFIMGASPVIELTRLVYRPEAPVARASRLYSSIQNAIRGAG